MNTPPTTDLPDNVDRLELPGKTIVLVGTAHLSQASTDLVAQTIRTQKPESVAVELCAARHSSLQDPNRWKNTDIVKVIREGKAYVLLLQLLLAGFQKRLGDRLGVRPGAEMMCALDVAKEIGAAPVLADRDVRTTLKRAWGSVSMWTGMKLVASAATAAWGEEQISAEQIEQLKQSDQLEGLLHEFSTQLPQVREVLIDERDLYLAEKIRTAPGATVVAVVGAGHVPGIKRAIARATDLAPLETVPPPRKIGQILGWGIPVGFVLILIGGLVRSGSHTSLEMIESWIVVNGSFAAFGALLAGAHPLSILAAFISAPITTLSPLIGSGMVAGVVEATVRRPRVADFENVGTDLGSWRGVWNNRLCRILLTLALTSLTGVIGLIVGFERLASLLQR